MVMGDGSLVGAADGAGRRHLAVDALHVHCAACRGREPAARPGRGGTARWRQWLPDLPRYHLAGDRAHRRDRRADPPHRGVQDHRPAQCADRRRARPRDRIDDAPFLHRLAHPGSRQFGGGGLYAALHLDHLLCILLQFRGTAGAPVRSMSAPQKSLAQRLFEPKAIDRQSLVAFIISYALLFLWALVVLVPLYWVLITSFKGPGEFDNGPFHLPFIDFTPSLQAWDFMLLQNYTLGPYLNSVVVALVSTALAVLIGSLAAYALVRIRFEVKLAGVALFVLLLIAVLAAVSSFGVTWPIATSVALALFIIAMFTFIGRTEAAVGNNDIEFWIISNRIMPPIVAVLPIYVMFQQLRLLDTQVALIATYTAVNLPIVVWLTRDFFAAIPLDLEESAEIDGASKYRVLFTIALPLARSGLAATFMLVFILSWNEYLLALFLSNVKAQTMPVLVSAQNGTRGPQWWYMSVLIVIMIAPVVVITAALQRHIARGILLGAV